MGMRLGQSVVHRQRRLRSIKGLDLALFIDAQHQRFVGRVEVETNHIPHLLDKVRIGRELEAMRQMRLKSKGAPHSMDKIPRHIKIFCQTPHAPVRGFLRPPIECCLQNLLNLRIVVPSWLTAPRSIRQASQSITDKPASPLCHRLLAGAVALCDLLTGISFSAVQHDPRPKVQSGAPSVPTTPALEFRPFLLAQYNLGSCSSHGLGPD